MALGEVATQQVDSLATPPDPKVVRLPRLDGIRALAVLLVLFFHGGFGWAGGGFFGVDVFFVLSGFLITGLLLSEFAQTASLRLGRFWAHRVRRLMPALLFLLLVVAFWAAFFASPASLHQTRIDGLASLFYVNNWNLAHGTQGYFAALSSSIPRPLLHTWSLSIEEQFYLVWPLVVLGVLKLTRSLRLLFALALTGAVASAIAMALIAHNGANQSRAYYGTDTRAQAVLIGAALAILLAHPLRSRRTAQHDAVQLSMVRSITLRPWAERSLSWAGALSFVALLVLATQVNDQTTWFYQGGFFLFSMIAAVLVASVALVPHAKWGTFLELRPVRYIGAISYGLYLWHWPLYMLLDHQRTGLSGVPLFALRIGTTFAISALSLRFLEMPIRRGRLRGIPGLLTLLGTIALTAVLLVVATSGPSTPVKTSAATKALNQLIAAASTNETKFTNDGTLPKVRAVPAPGVGPDRILVLGDSEAVFLSFGLGLVADQHHLLYEQDGVLGCGFLNTVSRVNTEVHSGKAGLRGSPPELVPCATQLTRWTADVNAYQPDLILLVNGAFEVHDRLYKGKWTSILNPTIAKLEKTEIQRAIDTLKPSGATIVLSTAPFYHQPERLNGTPWPEDDPARVRAYNKIVREVAAANAPQVKVLDVNKVVSPNGKFSPTLDGIPYFMDDGIHLNPEGAKAISQYLIGDLSTWAAQSRAARFPGSPPQ